MKSLPHPVVDFNRYAIFKLNRAATQAVVVYPIGVLISLDLSAYNPVRFAVFLSYLILSHSDGVIWIDVVTDHKMHDT